MKEVLDRLSEIQAEQIKMLGKQDRNTEILSKHSELLEKFREDQIRQNETLLRNTITVEEHHRRSLALERQIEKVEREIEPIKTHVENVVGIGKFFRYLGYIAGSLTASIGLTKIIIMLMGK